MGISSAAGVMHPHGKANGSSRSGSNPQQPNRPPQVGDRFRKS